MIAIFDYDGGNQTSVQRALNFLQIENCITNEPHELENATGIIFPGVGAAGQAMQELKEKKLDILLKDLIAKKKPLLGICVGCQLLLEYSEENDTKTLGIFPGKCKQFTPDFLDERDRPIRIPHMGWNTLTIEKTSPLFENIADNSPFYFVHSYYPIPDEKFSLASCEYGTTFCAVLVQMDFGLFSFILKNQVLQGYSY